MPRSIWSGAISFGLVNVPVKLYSAVSQKEVRFHMVHEKDGGRIRQKRVCSVDGDEVPYEEIIKGYEISPDRYVTVTREELEKFDPKATKSIDIEDFVELEEIDPIFFESTYYLAPDKGASKAYALLLAAMQKTGKVGIARLVLRTKQYLCAVRPKGDALVVSTMNYADEVVSADALEELPALKEFKPKEKELEMAEKLIDVAHRRVRARQVQGRLPREGHRAAPEEGGGRGDRRRGRGGSAREGGRPDGGAQGEPEADRGRRRRGEGRAARPRAGGEDRDARKKAPAKKRKHG